MRLNLSENNSHPCPAPRMSHLAHSRKARSGVLNPYQDSRSSSQRFLRGHAASEQAYVACLLDKLPFRFHIRHFNRGYKGVAACAWTLRLHEDNPLFNLSYGRGGCLYFISEQIYMSSQSQDSSFASFQLLTTCASSKYLFALEKQRATKAGEQSPLMHGEWR